MARVCFPSSGNILTASGEQQVKILRKQVPVLLANRAMHA
jgi:hypothetical protein